MWMVCIEEGKSFICEYKRGREEVLLRSQQYLQTVKVSIDYPSGFSFNLGSLEPFTILGVGVLRPVGYRWLCVGHV